MGHSYYRAGLEGGAVKLCQHRQDHVPVGWRRGPVTRALCHYDASQKGDATEQSRHFRVCPLGLPLEGETLVKTTESPPQPEPLCIVSCLPQDRENLWCCPSLGDLSLGNEWKAEAASGRPDFQGPPRRRRRQQRQYPGFPAGARGPGLQRVCDFAE